MPWEMMILLVWCSMSQKWSWLRKTMGTIQDMPGRMKIYLLLIFIEKYLINFPQYRYKIRNTICKFYLRSQYSVSHSLFHWGTCRTGQMLKHTNFACLVRILMVYLLSKLEVWNQFCWLQLLCCMSCLQNSSTIDQNLPVTPTSRLWKPWLWKFYSDGCEFFQYQSPWVWLIAYSTMCSEFAYFTISFCFMANEYYVILWLIYIYIYIFNTIIYHMCMNVHICTII